MDFNNARLTIYGRLNELAYKDKPAYSFISIRDDFNDQFQNMLNIFDCIQLLPGHRIRLTCKSEEAATFVMVNGLSFRGLPVELTAAKFERTVRIHRLPYELELVDVRHALFPYGNVISLAREFNEYYTGVLTCKMGIEKPIPSKITIKGQSAVVVYKGHNRIVDRLVHATRFGVVLTDRTISE